MPEGKDCALVDATLARLSAEAMNALARTRARRRRMFHSTVGSPYENMLQ
jgi:hypothetical protein